MYLNETHIELSPKTAMSFILYLFCILVVWFGSGFKPLFSCAWLCFFLDALLSSHSLNTCMLC